MEGIWLRTGNKFDYGIVTNICIDGLEESILSSRYPMLKLYDPIRDNLWSKCAKDSDVARATRLATTPSGSGHDCFLKGCLASFDLTLSVKCWAEAERYKFFNFVSSMSSLRLAETNSDIAFIHYTSQKSISILKELMEEYQKDKTRDNWLKMVYNLPSGLLLSARMTTNYMQLKTIYNQRSTHRLPEWQEFCYTLETFPHSEWITKTEDK